MSVLGTRHVRVHYGMTRAAFLRVFRLSNTEIKNKKVIHELESGVCASSPILVNSGDSASAILCLISIPLLDCGSEFSIKVGNSTFELSSIEVRKWLWNDKPWEFAVAHSIAPRHS